MTDNQVLKYFFTKTALSWREARWFGFLGQFGITKLTLIKSKAHALGDEPSRAPHVTNTEAMVKTVFFTSPTIALPHNLIDNYMMD